MTAVEFLESWASQYVTPVADSARRDERHRLAGLCVAGAVLVGLSEQQLEDAAMMDVESFVDERIEEANWELMDEVLAHRT